MYKPGIFEVVDGVIVILLDSRAQVCMHCRGKCQSSAYM